MRWGSMHPEGPDFFSYGGKDGVIVIFQIAMCSYEISIVFPLTPHFISYH
jgi:hypothetical protein